MFGSVPVRICARRISLISFTQPLAELLNHHPKKYTYFPTKAFFSTSNNNANATDEFSFHDNDSSSDDDNRIRLSKIISSYSKNFSTSRRKAEELIKSGRVSISGITVTVPHHLISLQEAIDLGIKANGKLLDLSSSDSTIENKNENKNNSTSKSTTTTKVWCVHKLSGELVTENDIYDRPSMLQRLYRGGVGRLSKKNKMHLKPIGRLDMLTEGLILVTNNGTYAREMELPQNKLHRTYRVRVFGNLTQKKLDSIRNGNVEVNGVKSKYKPMKVSLDRVNRVRKLNARNNNGYSGDNNTRSSSKGPANTWLEITCTEGKNRMIRNVLGQLGLQVTRLIRTSYGDFSLQTIPPGMAIEVPVKPAESHRRAGSLHTKMRTLAKNNKKTHHTNDDLEDRSPVQWIRSLAR